MYMKILVISDIHNKKGVVKEVVSKHKPDYIFFLGDGINIINEELNTFNSDKLYIVKGNCDLFSSAPIVSKVELAGYKFLLTHGHEFRVKQTQDELATYAKIHSIDVVCFGHTHASYKENISNISFFNPGSIGSNRALENSFGIIEINDKEICLKIEKNKFLC